MLAKVLDLDECPKKPATKKHVALSNIRQQNRTVPELFQESMGPPDPPLTTMPLAVMSVSSIGNGNGPPVMLISVTFDWDDEGMNEINKKGGRMEL